MKILITGGLGYLGTSLLTMIDSNENQITVLDKCAYGINHANILFEKDIALKIGDVRDNFLMEELVAKSELVIHLAAIVGGPVCARNPWESSSTNLDGTTVIAKAVEKYKKKILFASTGTTYGPMSSDCDELQTISPATEYGEQKAKSEKIVLEVGGVSLRFSTVFGLSPRIRDDLFIHSVINKAIIDQSMVLYEPNAIRSFINIKDAARSIMHFGIDNYKSDVFNIGDKEMGYTKKEICELVKDFIPEFTVIENNYSFDKDRRNYKVKTDKAESSGFKCIYDMKSEINKLIKYYKARHFSSANNG